MFEYLFLIVISSGEYLIQDPLNSYYFTIPASSVLKSSALNLFILSCSSGLTLEMLDFSMNHQFNYTFQSSNIYTCLSLSISYPQIYAYINVNYTGDVIPALVGNLYPEIGKIHDILMTFNFQGQIVRSQIIGNCVKSNTFGLDFYFYHRAYIARKDFCINSLSVEGLSGENSVFYNDLNIKDIMIRGYGSQVFLAFMYETYSEIINFNTNLTVFSISNQKIIDFQIGETLSVITESSVYSINLNNSVSNSLQLSGMLIHSMNSADSLLIFGNIYSNVLDCQIESNQGSVLLEFSFTLTLNSYRCFSNILNIDSLNLDFPNLLIYNSSKAYVLESPFSQTSVKYCKTQSQNFLGEVHCSECLSGYLLIGGHCLVDLRCEAGSIQDFYTMTCSNCFSGCSTCFGLNPNQCITCRNNYYLIDNQCFSICPQGNFGQYGLCKPCPQNCSDCDQSQCYFCNNTYLFNGTCVEKCPQSSYLIDDSCLLCEEFCVKCNEKRCLQCQEGYFLNNGTCSLCDKNCLVCAVEQCSQCKSGYFWQGNVCKSCNLNCEVCDSKGCLQCKENYALINHTCNACPNNGTCENCSEGCLNCNETECFNCAEGLVKVGSKCLNCTESECIQCQNGEVVNGTCQEKCGQGFEFFNGTCRPCPQNCLNCSDGLCKNCITNYMLGYKYELVNGNCTFKNCLGGYTLKNETCILTQNTNYFDYFLSFFELSLKI